MSSGAQWQKEHPAETRDHRVRYLRRSRKTERTPIKCDRCDREIVPYASGVLQSHKDKQGRWCN